MNILIITPYIPFPLSEGGSIAQYAVIDYLRREHHVHLIVPVKFSWDIDRVNALQKALPDIKVYEVNQMPPPSHLSVKGKLGNLLGRMAGKLARSADSAKTGAHSSEGLLPFAAFGKPFPPQFVTEILRLVAQIAPDIIQVDLLEYIGLGVLLPTPIKKVFVHHEMVFSIVDTLLRANSGQSDAFGKYIFDYIRYKEAGLLHVYDGVVVFSDDDRQKLQPLLQRPVFSIPFPVLDSAFQPLDEDNLHIQKLVFLGGEKHFPNKDAVLWYINEMSEKIYGNTQLVLHVIGDWSDATRNKYRHLKSVHFAGFVPDIAAYCKNSIMLVPVRIGSGIRTKILYAMAQGTPVIATTIGAEGIRSNEQVKPYMTADTPNAFFDAIQTLVTDKSNIADLVAMAQQVVRDYYSQERIGKERVNCFEKILNRYDTEA